MYSRFQRAPIYLLSVTVNHFNLNIFDFSFKVGRKLDDSVRWWQILAITNQISLGGSMKRTFIWANSFAFLD